MYVYSTVRHPRMFSKNTKKFNTHRKRVFYFQVTTSFLAHLLKKKKQVFIFPRHYKKANNARAFLHDFFILFSNPPIVFIFNCFNFSVPESAACGHVYTFVCISRE